jgi:tRNA threonylcarbamoyladenosine biosynthesis protein TsaB
MILCIETSTAVLSVALARDGAVVCERVCTEPRSQAALTAPLVKEVLSDAGITAGACDAVCVSAGPGSYTGLRVGVSTAKGLAFGAGIPLLSMGTLDILVEGVEETPAFIVPMIDARRMEVYTAVYSAGGDRLTEVEARVIGPDAFAEYLEQGEVLFVGDGALKCQEVITHPNARFREAFPLARHMARRAQEDFDAGKFQDVAYFEPFYLKDFIATVSKKNLW